MDKELLDLLNQARSAGANEAQLQGVVDAYNLKKKNSAGAPSTSSDGELQSKESNPATSPVAAGNSGSSYDMRNSVPSYQSQVSQNNDLSKKYNLGNNFGAATHDQLAQGQIAPAENTVAVAPKQSVEAEANKTLIPIHNKEKADYKAKVIKSTPQAIENAAVKSLKLKGIDPSNAAILNKEKQHFQDQVADGDATVSFDKDGNAGLVQNEGFFKSFVDHVKSGVGEWMDARDFKNMSLDERVKFANDAAKGKASPYLGAKPTDMGSVGALAGDVLPTIGRYAAGAAVGGALSTLAPETGGLSTLALKPVMSFVTNAGVEANISGMNGTLQRYYALKQKNPTANEKDLMQEAQKGEDVDRLAGVATGALFSETGGVLGKSVTKTFLKEAAKSGVDIGAKMAAVEGARDVGHNLEGVTDKSGSDIAGDMGKAFEENAPMGVLLHAFMGGITGLAKIPAMIKSGLKYDIVTKMKPEEVNAELQKNVQSGAITPEQAQQAANELGEFSEAVKTVPSSLSDESKASAAGLIVKRNHLEQETQQLDRTAQDLGQEQATGIDNQIKKVYATDDPFKAEINPNTGDTYENKSNEKENKIPDTQEEAGITNETVSENSTAAKEKDAGELWDEKIAEGGLGVFKNMPKEEGVKMVAEQAQNVSGGKTSDNLTGDAYQSTVNQFGKDLVDAAIEKYPAPKDEGKTYDANSGKNIIEPSKPISEMNSEEIGDYAKQVKDALRKQDKEFENKTEAEKEAAGYYDYIDNVSDLRDAEQRVNFVENSESLNDLANSTKSALRDFNKDNPSQESLAILNAAKKKAAEMNIDPETLIKEVIKKVGNDYKDKTDAEDMMRSYLEKIVPTEKKAEQQPIVNSNSDAVPKEIADLYSEAANLRFTLNALDKQMGGRELAGKAKAEYDRTKARLDNVEIKLSDYEKSKENISSQLVENVKDQPKQIFEDGQVVNYYDDLFDKNESVKILYKTGDGEGGKERYQIQFENGKEASVWSDNLTKENKPTISKEQAEPVTKEQVADTKKQVVEIKDWDLPTDEFSRNAAYIHIKQGMKDGDIVAVNKNGEEMNIKSPSQVLSKTKQYQYNPDIDYFTAKTDNGRKILSQLNAEKVAREQTEPKTKEQSIPDKIQEDKNIESKKDLAQRAREEAKKFREGEKNVLPSFLRANLPEGTKKAGIDINIAWANALEAFANVHDATKDFAKAVEAGYKHLKDWFEENKVPFDGNKLKSDFENEMKGAAKTEKPEAKAAEKVEPEQSKNNNGGGEKPPSEGEGKSSEGEPSKVGVSHAALTKMSEELGTEAPQRGKRLSAEEYADIGRKLLNSGADVEKMEADFKAGKQPTVDDISIARAHLEDLHEIANAMGDKWGRDSSQYKKALAEEQRFVSEVVKPMGTKISEPFTALQGERDINTGSFTSLARVREENKGEPLTEVENQKAKELSEQVTVLSKEVEDLKNKLTDLLDKGKNVEETKKTLTEKAKNLADKFRKLKTKPFKFKDENGNDIDITKAGISWNDLVEFGAKAIEKTGEIADGVKVIIDKIKDEEWFVKLSNNDKQKFADDLYNHLDSEVPDILTKYVDKKGNKFTSEEAKEIWDYAKDNYLDKGKDFDQMINGTAADLGLKPEQVRDALITPKGAKQVTDEMYKKQIDRNKAVQRAKDWAKAEKVNPFVKALKSIPRFFFAAKVFGHGTVGMITHAGVNLFDPVEWKRYWPVFFKQFKFAYGSEIRYEKAMQDLQNDAQYLFWKRAGLAVDPSTRYDDYQFISRIFEKMGKVGRALTAGDRGFNALKVYRLERAKAIWNGLSEAEKADRETPRTIAELVNHSTGTTNLKVSNTANTVFFAPNLELSRWNKLIVDPSKAVKTLTEWNIATPAEKARAKLVGARAARIFGTFVGALAVNQALLSLSGSNQKINFTDPTSSDWLKFKTGGRTIDATGGVISLLGFLVRLGAIPFSDSKKSKKDAVMQQTWNYASGKFSPFASTGKDVLTHHDFSGNTLPFFNDKPLHSWNKKLSLSEYLTQQQTPIPVAEYFHDLQTQMEKQGVHKAAASDIIKSIFVAAMVGGTGAHIGEEPMTKRTQFTDEDLKDPTFKYYLDKGLSLPETSLTSEVVTDEKRKNKFSVSDQPKEIQDEYVAVHKEQLRKELAGFLKRRVVFVKTYSRKDGSEESAVYKDRPDGAAKIRAVNSLSQDELKQVLSMAQRMATKDTKKIVFKQK